MSSELQAAGAPPLPAIRSGAELVHLAEGLQLQLFLLCSALVVPGSVVALVLGVVDDGGLRPATFAGAAGGLAFAALALARPAQVSVWLRYGEVRRLGLVAFAAAIVLADGVDGPTWWVALTLLLVLATLSSMRFALAAGVAVALAFNAGTLLAGGSLARHGADVGVLAGSTGFPACALIGRVVCEGFARLVLSLHRAQVVPAPVPAPPVVVPNLAPGAPRPPRTPRRAPRPRTATDRLTVRQLEVVLLVRDGLLQPEIAAALGISVTQVERHLRQARERLGLANTNELMATVVRDGLIGDPS